MKTFRPAWMMFVYIFLWCMFSSGMTCAELTKNDVTDVEYTNPLRVAVIRDADKRDNDELLVALEDELRRAYDSYDLKRPILLIRSNTYLTNFDFDRASIILKETLADDRIDVLLSMSPLVDGIAAEQSYVLNKPVISNFVERVDALGLPYSRKDGTSGKPNFTFVVIPLRMTEDLMAFDRMIDFETVHILVDSRIVKALNYLSGDLAIFEAQVGFKLKLIQFDGTAQDAISKIRQVHKKDKIQAMYLSPPVELNDSSWYQVIQELNALKIPTFSMLGHEDVQHGVLAAITPDLTSVLAEKIAGNIVSVGLYGKKAHELSVYMPTQSKLLLNAETARQIGFFPSFAVLREADFISVSFVYTVVFVLVGLVSIIVVITVLWRGWKNLNATKHIVEIEEIDGECYEVHYEILADGTKKLLTGRRQPSKYCAHNGKD